ncbi:hypothetical protein SD70_18395 [Gordoniibacillus kamchatkensis]|uniref:Uncharacterized protein n=1 Tax=Gordoniibacillus kamchatkensis TaxID=1590651 RepID=A0ABR5AF98_9BACL|nr:hypothetical protein SD70_18395 [Paenibacillus sp. VKM B-2647]
MLDAKNVLLAENAHRLAHGGDADVQFGGKAIERRQLGARRPYSAADAVLNLLVDGLVRELADVGHLR